MQGFDLDELLLRFRYPLLILLGGLILIGVGVFYYKSGINFSSTKVEVLTATSSAQVSNEITVEIAGEVIYPGVYKLSLGSRVDDLLVVAGGFSAKADRNWTDKYLNRAAKLTDGQKVYIPSVDQQLGASTANKLGGDQSVSSSLSSDSSNLININTGSLSELDSLPGIGPVYAQSIIDHRPYSNTSELLSKGALKQSVYDKIKDLVTVY